MTRVRVTSAKSCPGRPRDSSNPYGAGALACVTDFEPDSRGLVPAMTERVGLRRHGQVRLSLPSWRGAVVPLDSSRDESKARVATPSRAMREEHVIVRAM